jgi:hypothetical protein
LQQQRDKQSEQPEANKRRSVKTADDTAAAFNHLSNPLTRPDPKNGEAIDLPSITSQPVRCQLH